MRQNQTKDAKYFPQAFEYRGSLTRRRFKWEELKTMIMEFGTLSRVAEVLDLSYSFVYNYVRGDKKAYTWYKTFRKEVTAAKTRSRRREAHKRKSNLTIDEISMIHLHALECARVAQLDIKRKRRAEFIEEMAKDDPLFAKALRDLEGAEIA